MKTYKVRPVLVSTENKVHDTYMIDRLEYQIDKKLSINGIEQELILISLEDEKIEVGDIVLYHNPNTQRKLVVKVSSITNDMFDYERKTLEIREIPTIWAKKVIARQSQISPELIQQLVDEYNNGDMKDFEIEINSDIKHNGIQELLKDEFYQNFPEELPNCVFIEVSKLTNGFVTVVKKEPILYTEEEVKLLFENWLTTKVNEELMRISGEIDVLDGVDFYEWFERNKKK